MPRRHRVLLGRARVYGPDIVESRARLRPVIYVYVKQVLTGKQWINNLKMNFKNQTPIESIDEIKFY